MVLRLESELLSNQKMIVGRLIAGSVFVWRVIVRKVIVWRVIVGRVNEYRSYLHTTQHDLQLSLVKVL